MTEYQYYEFQAIDRPLTPEEQRAVARLSSRVEPHPRRAVFTYSFGGDLRLRDRYGRRPALMRRLREAGLIES